MSFVVINWTDGGVSYESRGKLTAEDGFLTGKSVSKPQKDKDDWIGIIDSVWTTRVKAQNRVDEILPPVQTQPLPSKRVRKRKHFSDDDDDDEDEAEINDNGNSKSKKKEIEKKTKENNEKKKENNEKKKENNEKKKEKDAKKKEKEQQKLEKEKEKIDKEKEKIEKEELMRRKEEAFMQNSVHFIRSLSDGEGCHDADRHDEVDDDSMPEVDHHDHVENNDGSDNPIESVSSESDDDNLKEVHSMPFDSPHNKSTAKLPKPKTPSTPLDKQHKPAKSSLSTPLDNQCKPAKSSPSTPLDKQRIPAKSSPSTPLGKQHKPAKSSPSTPLHKQHKPAKSSPSTPLDKQRNPAKSSPSTPLDKQHKPAKSSPSTQVDGKGKPAKTDFPSHNESPKSSASEILSPRKRLIASQMKGAAKSPYFQKPKSCYFCTLKENKAKETNAKIAELEDEIARLNRVLAGGNYIESLGRPKSGLIPSKIAKKYQLEQLAPGFDVYVDQEEFRTAATKSNGTGAVLFLLSCFYTHSELLEMNLTGENGKKPVNKEILKAMYAYALDKGDSKAKLAVALRNKIEQIRTRHRKASNQVEGENALTNNK